MSQFKDLVLSAERDQLLKAHNRKMLSLTVKGWHPKALIYVWIRLRDSFWLQWASSRTWC